MTSQRMAAIAVMNMRPLICLEKIREPTPQRRSVLPQKGGNLQKTRYVFSTDPCLRIFMMGSRSKTECKPVTGL